MTKFKSQQERADETMKNVAIGLLVLAIIVIATVICYG